MPLIAIVFLLASLSMPQDNTEYSYTSKDRIIGASLLGAEYIGGSLIAYSIWWRGGFDWDNPFKYIGEKEPFHEDDLWHFMGGNGLTEIHYRILKRYMMRRPEPLACGLSFLSLTGIETFDALTKGHRWEFSLNDELANCLGIGFWYFKHKYPDVPVDVRIGVRKWGEFPGLFKQAYYLFTDFHKYSEGHLDRYAMAKVEAIWFPRQPWYCGIALSKKDGESKEDLFGICVGYDVLRRVNSHYAGWWNTPLTYVTRYVSLSLSLTYWFGS